MRRVTIEEFLAGSEKALLLDVRSPAEYAHAHIPGAVSLPLFTDEERKVVGTAYKQVSRQVAIKIGLDAFGPKMRRMVEQVETLVTERWPLNAKNATNEQPSPVTVFVYCWRGGMRSGAVSWLLNLYGFNVTVLAGGYKSFRNYALQTFEQPFTISLIGGYTGSGKTMLLKGLQSAGEHIIDLERLASHKGSAFGNIGLPAQPTQEMFENRLCFELHRVSGDLSAVNAAIPNSLLTTPHSPVTIWLEDESQRIGLINIPPVIWQTMRGSRIYFLDIPFEERLQYLVAEYGILDKEKIKAAIQRITKRLGPLETKNALQFLQEGAIEDCFRILLQYYDKLYKKGLYNRQNLSSLLTNISCKKVTTENSFLVLQAQKETFYAGTN
ncbi:MAG TPA: tRNA 2-selenouridine(34) synthase MnmH [Flavisolibacter sp.]|jgi:tRNA 2-selenouridine synthase|nr:tRNA 2-selenouridine(34) synthase MnmH [Flavisolibacter sp.]